MFFLDPFFDRDMWYDDGPDRRGWADKSEAATRREEQANRLFDAFIAKCRALPEEHPGFPITEEVVGADTHLTQPCWSSFRKRVESRGCKAKRREATPAERRASGDHRKSKLYVVSVTVPVHPSKAIALAAEKKKKAEDAAAARREKAAEAARRKAERERKEAEERQRLAELHRAKVRERYDDIMSDGGKARKKEPSSPSKGGAPVVTAPDVLKRAMEVHEERLASIRKEFEKEKQELLAELEEKKRVANDIARQEHKSEKQKIRETFENKEN